MKRGLVLEKQRKWRMGWVQILKYSIIGLSCSTLDLGILNGLLYFFPTSHRGTLTLYNSIAYGFAVMNSYIWNSRYTFHHKSTHSYKQFISFVIQAITSLIINDVVFVVGIDLLNAWSFMPKWASTNTAKLTSMFCSSFSSFFFNKYFVFRTKRYPSREGI